MLLSGIGLVFSLLLLAIYSQPIESGDVPDGCSKANSELNGNFDLVLNTTLEVVVEPVTWYPFSGVATTCTSFNVAVQPVSMFIVTYPIATSKWLNWFITDTFQSMYYKGRIYDIPWSWSSGWHHDCWVVNETHVTLYDNGVLLGTRALATPKGEFKYKPNLLVQRDEKNGILLLNDVQYYDKQLSAEEVKEVACGSSSAPKGLIVWKNLAWCMGYYQKSTVESPPSCSK